MQEARQLALDRAASIDEVAVNWRNTSLHSRAQEPSDVSLDEEKVASFSGPMGFLLDRGADENARNEDDERPAKLVRHPALRQWPQ